MTVLENLMIAQHNKLMKDSVFSIGGIFGIKSFRKSEKDFDQEGNRMAGAN